MTSKRLAIVVPLFNPGQFLHEVLNNLRNCSEAAHVPIDIYLTDDSEDEFPGILNFVGEQEWGSVTYWKNMNNLGETENVNNAFMRVRELGYNFALLLHQDDLVSPTWLKFCATRTEDEADSYGKLWFCDILSVDKNKCDDLLNDQFTKNLPVMESADFSQHRGIESIASFYREFSWGPSGTLFHLDSFFEVGEFHKMLKYCADGDFGVRWLCNGFSMNVTKQAYCYRRLHPNQTTQTGIYSGIADQGYAYIMVRYRQLVGFKRRFREHIAWTKRRLSTGLNCIKSRRAKCVTMHVASFRIIFASLMTCLSPHFTWMLPASVKILLDNAPPVTFPNKQTHAHCEDEA